ncbi:uncharacterized protein LOC129216683 [Uloborus diversus]|uniref:uncharacterized protein LOC129216683 n=1 Tax=Uloborus diversus TaxID=327109 RepID=UPI00240A4F9D|nr:uncharacterized protein LOC129216683 [Uloborus diversus]
MRQLRSTFPMRIMSSKMVSLALVAVILGIHLLHACPLATASLCKQYGHSCLGGHGKRSENQPSRLMKYLLRELAHQPKQSLDIAYADTDAMMENRDFWEHPSKQTNDWNSERDVIEKNIFE